MDTHAYDKAMQDLRSLPIMEHDPSSRDRIIRDVSQVLRDVNGTLRPSLRSGRSGALMLKGTIPTKHQNHTYHTPVQFTLDNYPTRAPTVQVIPTPQMELHNRCQTYQMDTAGMVTTDIMRNWSPNNTLSDLRVQLSELFSWEPPLYSKPSQTQAANASMAQLPRLTLDPGCCSIFDGLVESHALSSTYYDLPRVRRDVVEAAKRFQDLPMKVVRSDSGKNVICLNGTVPCNYRGTIYHFPVQIVVPEKYPNPIQGGIPEPKVRPTEGMQIKTNHRHVDSNGTVYLQYLSEWNAYNKTLAQLIQEMIRVFEADPPVFSTNPRPSANSRPTVAAVQRPTQANRRNQERPLASAQLQKVLQRLEDEGEPKFEKTSEDAQQCNICMENIKDCLLVPCKHMCVCAVCVRELLKESGNCPLCRNPIQDVIVNIHQ